MPIIVANTVEQELTHLKASTLALAMKLQARVIESDVWEIGGLPIQVRVKRERHRGKETYFTRWYVGGRMRGENAVRYSLRRLAQS